MQGQCNGLVKYIDIYGQWPTDAKDSRENKANDLMPFSFSVLPPPPPTIPIYFVQNPSADRRGYQGQCDGLVKDTDRQGPGGLDAEDT